MFDVTLLSVAVMFVEPTPVTVARPVDAIVAAAVFEDVHVTCVVRVCVVLSLEVPTALYCCVSPSATVADAGVTAIDCSVAAVTVSVAELLVTDPDVALIVVLPTPAPVARPEALMVATVVEADLPVAVLVRFCVLPSLYVPVAVNCCVAPFAIDGAAGVTAIDCSVTAAEVTIRLASTPTLHVASEELVVKFPTKISWPPGVARSPARRCNVI